jgi:thiol-disulfide isomerase/thioredoxin
VSGHQPSATSHQLRAGSRQPSAIGGAGTCLVVLAIACLTLPPVATAQEEQVGLARGTAVRPVTIEDLDGMPTDLSPYVGRRPALFEFWATWCTNCAALEPRMRAAYRRHGGQVAFVVVAVGVNQSKASVKRHVDQHPLPASRVLWDTNGNAVRAFDTPATSYVVILDRQGKVAYTGIGPDQDLEAALARVIR